MRRAQHADAAPCVESIDVGYLRMAGAASAFLIRGNDGHVLVECGPAATRETLFEGLRQAGVEPSDIRHLLLTHIHLDHAGAAGHLAQEGAQVHVHPFGAGHLAEPGRLLASTRRVHGDAYDRFYGDMLPVPSGQLHAIDDGAVVTLAGHQLRAIHTPGHARHHIVWMLETADARHAFTGDLAGIAVPESDCIAIPTPPPEFDPAGWVASLQRVMETRPTHLWLTHGGCTASGAAAADRFLGRALARVVETSDWLRTVVTRHVDAAHALEAYRALEIPAARAAGVDAVRCAQFLDDGFLRMNLGGARRAFAAGA